MASRLELFEHAACVSRTACRSVCVPEIRFESPVAPLRRTRCRFEIEDRVVQTAHCDVRGATLEMHARCRVHLHSATEFRDCAIVLPGGCVCGANVHLCSEREWIELPYAFRAGDRFGE